MKGANVILKIKKIKYNLIQFFSLLIAWIKLELIGISTRTTFYFLFVIPFDAIYEMHVKTTFKIKKII